MVNRLSTIPRELAAKMGLPTAFQEANGMPEPPGEFVQTRCNAPGASESRRTGCPE
jgi:hypothetical protein